MLKREHIEALTRARAFIRECEREASSQPGYANGKFSEACRAADHALYNVLMVGRAWLGNSEVKDVDLFPD